MAAQAPEALPGGNPTSGVRTLALAPLEPRALTPAQVRSLKSVVDRLERFHAPKGRRNDRGEAQHGHARAMRDRAIVYVLLSTGLRREELVTLDVTQVSPREPGLLREAKRARLTAVVGKGGTTRTVFLSADARTALADYLEHERPRRCVRRNVGAVLVGRECRVASAWRAALAAVDQPDPGADRAVA